MTNEQLAEIRERLSDRTAPYYDDMRALLAEVERLRGVMNQVRDICAPIIPNSGHMFLGLINRIHALVTK